MKKEGKPFDYFILLEPTSPLRDVEDVDKSIEMVIDNPSSESIVGVAMSGTIHPAFMVVVGENGFLQALEPDKQTLRRQDLPNVYFFEGSVYVSEVDAYLRKRTFYHDKTMPYIVPEWKSHEVDDYVEASKRLPGKDIVLQTQDADYYLFKSDILAGLVSYSTDKNIAANVETITAVRAKEIIEMNKQGEKPLSLQEDDHQKPVKQHVDLAGGDISRFDKSKKKKKKKKKPSDAPQDNHAKE
jgi:hypothetical protein